MKNVGILGGLGPDATIEYYKTIISLANKRWEYKKPEIIIYSFDGGKFAELIEFNKDYDKLKKLLENSICSLYSSGADFGFIACNSAHIFFDDLEKTSPMPLISISDSIAKKAEKSRYENVGLIGTKMTMNNDFYFDSFKKIDLRLKTPPEESQELIHEKIVDELVKGIMKDETKSKLNEVCKKFINRENLDSLILGCTELPLILSQRDFDVTLLNPIKIHANTAFKYCLD
ncbi:MAG: aspartate/glutamate racemase family protein [Thermoplasmata archaeon]